MLRRDRVDGQELHESGVGEDDVHHAFFVCDGAVEPVEIVQIGDVALNGRHVAADLAPRLVEFGSPATGDEDVRALGDEPPGRCQADPAAAAGNDRYLVLQLHAAFLPRMSAPCVPNHRRARFEARVRSRTPISTEHLVDPP